jgi:hypothetical protein
MKNNFYIYIYLDPRKSGKYKYGNYCFLYEPFYVGKGKGKRYDDVNNGRSNYFKGIINKIKGSGLNSIILKIKEDLNEKNSFKFEEQLINLIGRKDLNKGPLINFTNGGEGISGYRHNYKTKKLMSEIKIKNFSDIKKEFEKINYKLLTEENEYKNAKQKLEYICDKGHKNSITWSNFKNIKYKKCCKICNKKNIRKNFSDIKKEFERINYKLLTEENEYKNSKQKLNYI